VVASLVLAACSIGVPAAGAPPGPVPKEPSVGRAKAQMCITCHGPLGVSNTPDAPHLAGQPRIYLVAQLKAFRAGTRKHEVMNVIAKPLADADIEALADWYSSLVVEAREKR
jgi:cytochrome c553